MRTQDFFGVMLRVLGIWFFIQAGVEATFLLLRLSGVLENLTREIVQDKFFAAFNLVVALILFGLADKIVALFYGRHQAE
jgi:hypothetical protein